VSVLIERFLPLSDILRPNSAEEEILKCVTALRRRCGLSAMASSNLEPLLASRNIKGVVVDDRLKADGALVPIGRNFEAGFQMVLRRDLPESRINFTVAHEICHTFFYERVPEIKFACHPVDQEEERLCNCGAEEILMPAIDVREFGKRKSVSLDSLQAMAARYRVSNAAMLIRLQKLRLWHAELFLWRKMTNGTFTIKRAWGGKSVDWRWSEPEIPERVLSCPAQSVIAGSTVWLSGTPTARCSKVLSFEATRHGRDVLVLVINRFKKLSRVDEPQQRELRLRS
jgi:Zn-dependent peptidase ImmA (M78 family)